MSQATFDFWFHGGFLVSFVLAWVALFVVGGIHIRAMVRSRRILYFPLYAFTIIVLAALISGLYIAVLELEPSNVAVRRAVALVLAWEKAFDALLAIALGLIATRGRIRD